MRLPRLALAVLLIAAPAAAGGQAPEGDLARLQGTWRARIGPSKDMPVTLVIKGHAVTVAFTSEQGQAHTVTAELKLDETASPRAMDWVKVIRDGKEASNVLAIYELRDDTLTIRSGQMQGDPRPSEFRPEGEGHLDQAVFTREKGETDPDAQ